MNDYVSIRIIAATGEQRLYDSLNRPLYDASGRELYVLASKSHNADNIISIKYSAAVCGDNIGIGSFNAASVNVKMFGDYDLLDELLVVELDSGSGFAPLGTFMVTECHSTGNVTEITACDAAYYAFNEQYLPTVSSGATVAQIVADVCGQCGMQMVTGFDGSNTISAPLTGYTCRGMLSYMAMVMGKNVLITRDNRVDFVWFGAPAARITPDNYYADGFRLGGTTALTGIVCKAGDQELTVGNQSNGIEITCPVMTQSLLDAVWRLVGNYTYPIAQCDLVDGVDIQPGTSLLISSADGTAQTVPVMAVELTLDGGCSASVRSVGKGTAGGGYQSPTQERIQAAIQSINNERDARIAAVAALQKAMEDAGGVYRTVETLEDGSAIIYTHDKPALADSLLVIRENAGGIAVSRDGGLTWDWGFSFVTGEAIAQTIYAGAGWIEELFATQVTASNLTVSGNSSIAGWNVTNGKIYGGDAITGTAVMQRPGGANGEGTNVFAAGGTSHTSYSDCPFRVTKDGTLYASKANVTGKITADELVVRAPNGGTRVSFADTDDFVGMRISGADVSMSKGRYLQCWVDVNLGGGMTTEEPVNLIGLGSNGNVVVGSSAAYSGASSGASGNTVMHGDTIHFVFRESTESSSGDAHIVADYSSTSFPRFRPNTDKGCNLGNSTYRWNDGYVDSMHTSSDRKLKDNITALTDNAALECFFMAVSPAMYTMKDGKRPHMGFIAQQLAEAAMDSVGDLAAFCASCVDDRGETSDFVPGTPDEALRWDLRYNELIAPLWAMVQLQQRRIEALEQKLKGCE